VRFIHKKTFFHNRIAQRWLLRLQILCAGIVLTFSANAQIDFGPLFSEFPLTIGDGQRTEILGPLFYNQQNGSEKTWALPPLFSHEVDPDIKQREDDFLYPLLTYERFGTQSRWQFVQLFSTSGGEDPDNSIKKRVTIFPFYFYQRSTNPQKNYTAIFPFYGRIQDRLFRDDIFFILFPIYGETRKHDVINENYFYPIFNLRHGDGMRGWQFWPIVGDERKVVTSRTNNWGDTETIGGYDHFFALWPIIFRQNNGIGTDNPEKIRTALPFYYLQRSPQRDSTSVLWPFFSWIDDRQKKYREWQLPYPFIVIARGEGKTTTRVFPFFSHARSDTYENDFYLWPFYKFIGIHSAPLDYARTRILFYLFQNTVEKNTGTGQSKHRVDLWPLFVYHRDFNGDSRLQIIAPIESFVPNNRGIERNWSPLWSFWVSENNPQTGAGSQSFLWNLYRREQSPTEKKFSLLFGLFQYQSSAEQKKLRLFFIPVINSHRQTEMK
jgi:hypothetical protein